MKKIEDYITTIPDFPKPGIMFRDVMSVFDDPEGLRLAIDEVSKLLDDVDYDIVAGTEARGFLFAMPIAYNKNKRFLAVRKKGKLPRETIEKTYELEYGQETIEIHKDAIKPGDKVVILDDLIATGGTVRAAVDLIEELGGEVVKIAFLIELEGLKGREKFKGYDVASVVKYPGA